MNIFSINTNPDLTKAVARLAHLKLGRLEIKKFSDGELYVRPKEKIRGKVVWVLGSTMPPSDNLLKLLILLNALKTNGAKKINLIIPYFGYARQNYVDRPNAPLTMKLMAEIISTAGPDKIFLFDIHDTRDLGYFKKSITHLSSFSVLVDYFKKLKLKNLLIFSPDQGGVHRAEQFAKLFVVYRRISSVNYRRNSSVFPTVGYCKKFRPKPNVAVVTLPKKFDVRGKNIILVDDMIDTAGTLVGAAEALRRAGARAIYACATHGVLSGPAIARIKKSPIKRVIITDTFPLPKEKKIKKIKIISVAPVIKKIIA